jgi:formamidopyrimidine-DNA glycosylase
MPELPEVESVRRGLEKHLPGARLTSIKALHPRALSPESIAPLESLNGLLIDQIHRRGKFLWATFKREELVLLAHLGMSGQFRVFSGLKEMKETLHQHVRMSAELRKGARALRLDFVDQRTFGWIRVDRISPENDRGIPDSIQHIAPDPFEDEFDRRWVIERLRSKKSEIKRAILDQSTLSGVGNIYADEALWRARIHPERLANSLTEAETRTLLSSIRSVMKRALQAGGTSFDHLYVNVNGESGYFSTRLAVYGREDEACRRCSRQIKRISFTNRSSHFCPYCQRSR